MKNRPELLNYLILIFLGLIWGSSFILIKKGLEGFFGVQVGSLRIIISFLALSPLLPRALRAVRRKDMKHIAVVALAGNGLPAYFFAIGETRISSALAGIINSMTPLFTFLIGVIIFGVLFKPAKLIGVILGLAGAAVLIGFGTAVPGWEGISYALLILLATVGYGISVNTIKMHLGTTSSFTIAVIAFSLLAVPSAIILFLSGFMETVQTEPKAWSSLGYIAILSVAGTALANLIFIGLTQRTNALFASSVTYLIPIVAFGWGLTANEPVTWIHVAGMVLILAGVYLSRNKKPKALEIPPEAIS